MNTTVRQLVLVRHGHSEWNLTNRFTGWTDVALTDIGLGEAASAGRQLASRGYQFDEAHISVLVRTHQTAEAILQAANHPNIPIHAHWRLNERHYGQLQGMCKQEIFAAWGETQARAWWRGYHIAPPELAHDDPRHPRHDALYCNVEPHLLPGSESLHDTLQRLRPYWDDVLAPRLRNGQRLLVVSHGNTLRALIMHLEGLTPTDIEHVEIPSATPLVYRFNADLTQHEHEWIEAGN